MKPLKERETMQRTIIRYALGAVGIILAIIFLSTAAGISIPGDYISYFGMEEYVGGDAYNYIIAANIRGSEIISATLQQSIYYAAAAILFVISLFQFVPEKKSAPAAEPVKTESTQPAPEEEIMPISATTVDLPPMEGSAQE